MTAADVSAAVQARRTSAAEVVRAAAARIEDAVALNAFLGRDDDDALRQAHTVDARVRAGEVLPLAGVPVAVKDNICTHHLPTTCASRLLEAYRSPFEATVVQRLRSAGAVIIGKTNMDEFAMGSSTENSAFGPTLNPVDPARVPGGSSGGSAAAVAAGLVPAALGSDTGGSVRQPAAFCGVVGIKPSYGRVSRYGLIAFASSLDHVGVFGRSVADATRLLNVVAGHDPRDATSAAAQPDLAAAAVVTGATHPLAGTVVGVPDEYFTESVDAGVGDACSAALAVLDRLGAEVRRVSLPHTAHAVATYYVIATAEASSNLSRFGGVHFGARAPAAAAVDGVYEGSRGAGFGAEVKRRIMLGTFALAAGHRDEYYGTALRMRTLLARDFAEHFSNGVNVFFTPTTPTPAFGLGERTGDPLSMYLSDTFTVTANLAGLPALSLPIGTVAGLPVGGQLIAPRWHEAVMIRSAAALERALA